ncbi:MAG: V-type ATP synthase subunit D [Candidatus Thorarchaeota archaeon]
MNIIRKRCKSTISFREFKPTKTNLMNLQKRLNFGVKGVSFLELKQEQLIFEIKNLWNDYKRLRKKFLNLLIEVMIKLNETYKEMGKNNFKIISSLSKIQFKPLINIRYIKKIGNIVPDIEYDLIKDENLPAYSFEYTSHFLDDLITMLISLFKKMIKLSEIEDIMLKHSISYKKITRRIHGLENIIIPSLNSDIKKIKDILEELQRENFVRLKNTKDLIYKKKSINV